MSTAKTTLMQRIMTVSQTETDLQKLAYAAKGLEALVGDSDAEYAGYYGVSWNEDTDEYERTGSATAAMTLPIQSRMRRCLLDDEGNVVGYLHPLNSNYFDNGAPATLDGSAGQVMVEIPKFYWRTSYVAPIHTWEISEHPRSGFHVYPDFIKDGKEVEYRYVSAYEAYRNSSGVLSSVSGVYPTTNRRRDQFRADAESRGQGWRQLTWSQWSCINLLMLIEYGDFDFKRDDRLTNGRTNLSGGSFVEGEYITRTGLSNELGNLSGGVSLGGEEGWSTDFSSYRGIENHFGHIWKILDGLTVDATADDLETPIPLWWTNNSAYFRDDSSDGMQKLADMPNIGRSTGYVDKLLPNTIGFFIPASANGSSSTYTRAYLSQNPDNGNGWRLTGVGGASAHEAAASPCTLSASSAHSFASSLRGGRLGF